MGAQIDLTKFNDAIDRSIAAIDKLDKRLEAFSKDATTLNRTFGSGRQFNSFVKSLNQLDATAAKSFKTVTQGINTLVEAMRRLPKATGNIGDFVNQFVALQKSLSGLQSTTSGKNIGAYFQSIAAAIGIVEKELGSVDSSKLLAKLDPLRQIIDIAKDVNVLASQSTNKGSNLKGVGETFKGLKSNIFDPVNAIIKSNTAGNVAFTPALLQGMKAGISGALDFVSSISSLAGRGLGNTNTALSRIPLIGGIFRTIKNVLNPSDAVQAANTLKQFFGVIQGISFPKNLPRAFDGISNLLSGLNSFNITGLQTGGIGGFARRLPLIGSVFRGLKNLIDPTAIRSIGVGLRSFTGLLQGVTLPRNLGAAFTGIARFLNSVNKIDVANLHVGFLSRLPFIGKIFAPAPIQKIAVAIRAFTGVLKDIHIPEGISAAFEGIADFIRSINNLSFGDIKTSVVQRLPIIGGFFDRVAAIFRPNKFRLVGEAVKQVAVAFKGIKIPEIGSLFVGLSQLAQDIKAGTFKDIDTSGFSEFISTVADGLNKFSKVNVDSKKLAGIGAALSGLSKSVGSGSVFGRGSGGGGSGGGIFDAAAGNFIAQAAFAALSKVKDFVGKLLTLGSTLRTTLQQIGQNLQQFGQQISQAGQRLNQAFSLKKLFDNPLTQVAADFDHLSNAIKQFGGLTDQEVKSAQDFADTIGIKYPLSANDALQATLDLIKAGRTLSETKFIIPNAADLSAVGDIDLDTATKALITATNVFQNFDQTIAGTYENVDKAASIFSSAADVSTATVQDLIDGLNNVGPAANLAGLNFRQTAAILAEFNDNGIKAGEAGTQLAQVLTALHKTQATDELKFLQDQTAKSGKEINLSLANADGSLRNLDDVIKSLNAAYKELGLSQSQVLESIGKIAGSRSRQGLAVLLGNNGFLGVMQAMDNTDTAAVKAAKLLDDFRGNVIQLGGSLSTLSKNVFLPLIKEAFEPFIKIMRTVVDGILRFNQALTQKGGEGIFPFIANIVLLTSTLVTLGGTFLLVVGHIIQFEGAMIRAGAAVLTLITDLPALIAGFAGFVAAATTIGAIIASVGLAIGGLAIVITEFRNVVQHNIGGAGSAFNAFVGAVQQAIAIVSPTFEALGRIISQVFGPLVAGENNAFGSRVAEFFNRLSISVLKFARDFEQVGAIFEVFGEFISAGFGGKTPAQIQRVDSLIERLSKLPLIKTIFGANANVAGIRNVFANILKGLTRVASSVDNIFSGAIGILFGEPGAQQRVQDGLSSLLATISRTLGKLTGLDLLDVSKLFDAGDIGGGLEKFLQVLLGKIRDFFVTNRNVIARVLGDLFSFGVQGTTSILSFILKVLGLDNAAAFVDDLGKRISDFIHSAVSVAINLLAGTTSVQLPDPGAFFSNLFGGENFANTASSIALTIKNLVLSALGQLPALLQSVGTALNIQPLIDLGITLQDSAAFKQLTDALSNIISFPFEAAGIMFDGLRDLVDFIGKSDLTQAIALIGGLAAIALNTGVLTTLFNVLKGAFSSFLLPAFGIITLVDALKNIHLLLSGDAPGFLVNTLGDIASTLLSFFGIDMSKEDILSRATTAIEGFNTSLPGLLRAMQDILSRGLDQILARFTLFSDQLRENLPGLEGFKKAFDTANFELSGPNRGANVFNALGDKGLGSADVHAFATTSVDKIIESFRNVLERNPDVNSIPQELFKNIVTTLNEGGLLDQALAAIDPGPVQNAFVRRYNAILSGTDIIGSSSLTATTTDVFTKFFADIAAGGGGTNDQNKAFFASYFQGLDLSQVTEDQLKKALDEGFLAASGKSEIDPLARNFIDQIEQSILDEARATTITIRPTVVLDPIVYSNGVFTNPNSTGSEHGARGGTPSIASTNLHGRANGGDLKRESAYQVHDTPHPEIAMFNDGTSILLTGRAAGRMVKMVSMAGAPSLITSALAADTADNSGDGTDNSSLASQRADFKQQQKDSTDQITKLLDDISKYERDYREKQADDQKKFDDDTIKAQEQFQHDYAQIITSGHDDLLDAVRRGDGAAALAAIKNAKKSTDDLQYNYNKQEKDRKDQFEEQKRQDKREFDEREADYADQLKGLKDQNDALAAEQAAADDAALQAQNDSNAAEEASAAVHAFRMEYIQTNSWDALLRMAESHSNTLDGIIARATLYVQSLAATLPTSLGDIFNQVISVAGGILNQIGASVGTAITNATSTGGNERTDRGAPAPVTGTGNERTDRGAVSAVGLPLYPQAGRAYTDITGKTWVWTGKAWQPASVVKIPGRAFGGALQSNSSYRIFDGSRPEIMNLGGNKSILSTGRNNGRITPVSGGIGGDTYNVSIGDIVSQASDPYEVAMAVRAVVVPEIAEQTRRGGQKSRSMLDITKRP